MPRRGPKKIQRFNEIMALCTTRSSRVKGEKMVKLEEKGALKQARSLACVYNTED